MSDSYTPDVGQRIDEQGRVSYDFDGHVHARGLDLDAGEDATPQDDRRVRWVSTANGALVAHIFGYRGANASHVGILANDDGTEVAAVDIHAAGGDPAHTLVTAQAGAKSETIIAATGRSGFVRDRTDGFGGYLAVYGPYSIDSGALDPGDAANAFLSHSLNAFVFPLAAPTDVFFGYDIEWVYENTDANTTRFAFTNLGPHNAARVVLAVFLLTIT